MSIFVLIVLCIVQGLTEFLPVSSSGHLLLFSQLFGINENNLLLNLFLHMATLVAVVIVYRKIIWKLIKKPFQPLTFKLILSTAITLVFAFTYELLNIDDIVTTFYGFCFLATGILLLTTHYFQKHSSVVSIGNEIKTRSAVLVGFVQGLAVLPGISRSGSTICTLLLMGESEENASEYSFLLSIPIIIGGFVFELLKCDSFSNLTLGLPASAYLLAFAITFLTAFVSLKLTLKLLKGKKFNLFGIYLVLISIFTIIFNLF